MMNGLTGCDREKKRMIRLKFGTATCGTTRTTSFSMLGCINRSLGKTPRESLAPSVRLYIDARVGEYPDELDNLRMIIWPYHG